MSILSRFTSWVSRTFGRSKSIGEKVFARLLSGFGSWGMPGGWSQDRREQVLHYRGWPYIAMRVIAEEIGALQPNVAHVRSPEEYEERIGKAARRGKGFAESARKRFVGKYARRKALQQIQPHEELEMVDSNHRLLRLLRNPNGYDTGLTFWFRTSLSLDLTGNFYWWVLDDGYGLPAEIWVLPPQWVWPSPKRDPDELISNYEVRPYGAPGGAGSFTIPAEEIVHGMYPHPVSMWDGYSPTTAMAPWIDVLESMDTCQFAGFKNQLGMDAFVKMDKTMDSPDPAAIARLIARLDANHRYEGNFRRPTVLEPGAEIVYPRGMAPYEMDYAASGDQKKDWVLAGWGVSKFMAGLSEDVNKASSRVAVANFFRKCIRPRLLLIDGYATEKLAKRIDESLIIYHDDPTADDPEERRADIDTRLKAHAITPNQVREMYGDEPYPHGGDDPIGTPTDVPLPWVSGDQVDVDAMAQVLQTLNEAKQKPPEQAALPGGMPGAGAPQTPQPPAPPSREGRAGPLNRLPARNGKALRNGHA